MICRFNTAWPCMDDGLQVRADLGANSVRLGARDPLIRRTTAAAGCADDRLDRSVCSAQSEECGHRVTTGDVSLRPRPSLLHGAGRPARRDGAIGLWPDRSARQMTVLRQPARTRGLRRHCRANRRPAPFDVVRPGASWRFAAHRLGHTRTRSPCHLSRFLRILRTPQSATAQRRGAAP